MLRCASVETVAEVCEVVPEFLALQVGMICNVPAVIVMPSRLGDTKANTTWYSTLAKIGRAGASTRIHNACIQHGPDHHRGVIDTRRGIAITLEKQTEIGVGTREDGDDPTRGTTTIEVDERETPI